MKRIYTLLIAICIFNNVSAQWQQIGLLYQIGNVFAINGNTVFTGTGDGIYKSIDNGTNWISLVDTGFLSFYSVNSFALSGDTIYAGTFGVGVYLSTDNGNSWTEKNTGLTSSNIYTIIIIDSNIFVGTNYGLFLSSNKGNNWASLGLNLTVSAMAKKDNMIFAGTNNRVFMSTNNGTTWIPLFSGMAYNTTVNTLLVNGNFIYAGTNAGLFVSSNNGDNWSALNNGLPSNTSITSLAIKGSNIFAGTINKGVYFSINNGSSWDSINTGLLNNQILSLAYNNNYLFAGSYQYVWRLPFSNTITTSVNSSNEGTTIGDGIFTLGQSCTVNAINETGYVFKNWTENGNIVCTNANYTFTVTNSRNLIANFNSTQGIDIIPIRNYVNIYPNPTKDKLTLNIENNINEDLTIKIYSIMGEQVKIVKVEQNNSQINIEDLSNGIYFIEFKSKDWMKKQKLIIQK